MTIAGYTDRLSVAPGERIDIMVSTDAAVFEVDIRRVGREDTDVERAATCVAGRPQSARLGSYAVVPTSAGLVSINALTAAVYVYPTALTGGLAISWSVFSLGIDEDGLPVLRLGAESLVGSQPLQERRWCVLAGQVDGLGSAWVGHRALSNAGAAVETGRLDGALPLPGSPIVLGKDYDGKLERPVLWGAALSAEDVLAPESVEFAEDILAAWNLGGDPSSTAIQDTGPNGLDGRLIGGPMRAVTGHGWTGEVVDHRFAPDQYAAIHFHTDDMEDAGFEPDASWTVPAGTPSGLYVAEAHAGNGRDRLPFVVRPACASSDRALVLLPTFTYLAYANERLGRDMATNRPSDWNPPCDPRDAWLTEHFELGRSLYDRHVDGSGVAHSSSLRPIPNMRDDYTTEMVGGPRHLAADRLLLAWLEQREIPYDVICDHDLDRDGSGLLDGYRLVITGSHPEYISSRMRTALERHLARGGRLAYLGGNGFYWIAATYPDRPHLLEVRRGQSGTRAWESAPGETHLAATGEPGGLWRHRGSPPNALVGVGFTAQGWDGRAVAYRRLPGADDPRAAFVFAGVEAERIGASGLAMGGAVGDEVDRADPLLGTPTDAIVLARSEPLSDAYQPVIEDQLETVPRLGGATNPDVRADMVLLLGADGSAVFSVGSISWIASLPVDPAASRITENVARAFLAERRPG